MICVNCLIVLKVFDYDLDQHLQLLTIRAKARLQFLCLIIQCCFQTITPSHGSDCHISEPKLPMGKYYPSDVLAGLGKMLRKPHGGWWNNYWFINWLQLALEQHGFELCESTHICIVFHQSILYYYIICSWLNLWIWRNCGYGGPTVKVYMVFKCVEGWCPLPPCRSRVNCVFSFPKDLGYSIFWEERN